MNGIQRILARLLPLLMTGVGYFSVFAADDDIVIDAANTANVNTDNFGAQHVVVNDKGEVLRVRVLVVDRGNRLPVINDMQFEQQIFPQDGNAERGRSRINEQLEQAINELDQICQLTDEQKHKLDLAGRTDRKRFLDRVEAVRQKRHDGQQRAAEVQADINWLRTKSGTGLMDPNSFFAKTLQILLTEEQLLKINAVERPNHRAALARLLELVDSTVTLNVSQRHALSRMIRTEIRPTIRFGNSASLTGYAEKMVAMYQFSLLAEDRVKPLLDAEQWQELQPRLKEFDELKTDLVKRGLLDPDTDMPEAVDPAIQIKEPK